MAEGANTFGELAKKSEGIKKIAVLRADVDNLGTSFVYGFRRGEDERYVTLSRTAALSRQLSLFFKGLYQQNSCAGDRKCFCRKRFKKCCDCILRRR